MVLYNKHMIKILESPIPKFKNLKQYLSISHFEMLGTQNTQNDIAQQGNYIQIFFHDKTNNIITNNTILIKELQNKKFKLYLPYLW